MRVRRLLTIASLASSLLLLVAIPAWAAGCGPVADLLTCDPQADPPEIGVTPEGYYTLPGAPGSAPATGTGGPPVVDTEGARRLLQLANQERAAAGLTALTSRADLVDLALEHTFAMVERDSIFHNLDLLERPLRSVLGADVVGENVGWSTDVDDLHRLLMASPLHRASLLEPRFSVVGMAVVLTGEGRYYATQDFAQPNGVAPAPPGAPASAAPVRVTPVVDTAPSVASTPRPRSTPATDPAPAPPTESTATTEMSDDPVPAPTGLAMGEVESIFPTRPVAADAPGERAELLALATILATVVAVGNATCLYRDRQRRLA